MALSIHRRNIRFRNQIAHADKSRILGVAIDSSSQFHRVIIFNFLGKLIYKPFSIDILQKGFNTLLAKINKARIRISAEKIFIAFETAGAYSENLYQHLQEVFGPVVLIPPYAVSTNRNQRQLRNLKTDDIDCGSIADLLIRGEFDGPFDESLVYYRLRNLVVWRDKKLSFYIMLRQQINNRMSLIFPGLNSVTENEKKLYCNEKKDYLFNGLINHPMTGQEVMTIPNDNLRGLFEYTSINWVGRHRIKMLKSRLTKMMLPISGFAKVNLELLIKDVRLLRQIEKEIAQTDEDIIALAKQTPAKYLMGQIKGVSDLFAAQYIGVIGDIKKYKTAKHIFSKSGLAPRVQQSGSSDIKKKMVRTGDRLLRTLLFRIARTVVACDPYYRTYYRTLRKQKHRFWIKNYVAIARKINNVFFALIRDKSIYKQYATAGGATMNVDEKSGEVRARSLVMK